MNKKGFTLIEMLVVVAVIAILSGLTLTGIGGFTSRARDTRRIGDMRTIQTYVESYLNRCGIYPGTGTCGSGSAGAAWSNFQDALEVAISVNAPKEQVANRTYFYGTNSANLTYVIGVKLENDNRILKDDAGELDSADLASGERDITVWTPSGTSAASCDDASPTFGYCIGS